MNSTTTTARAPGAPRWLRPAGWILIALTPPLVFGATEACLRALGVEPSLRREASVPAWLDRSVLAKEGRWIELLSGSPRDLRNYYRTYRFDRDLFYALQPGLDLPLTDITAPPEIRERTRWTFHTNAHGFNAKEVPLHKRPGVFRIVAVGDSSTFGWGVDSDRAYPHVLETLLRRLHPGLDVEVVNLGVCGYSSFQGLILLEREALRWSPDVVTISYGSNDYSRVPEEFDAIYARNQGWTGALLELLNRSRAYQVYAGLLLSAIGTDARGPGGASGESGVLNVGPEKSRRNLERSARLVRRAGAEPVFVTNCVPGEMAEPIRAAATSTGAPLVDTRALLEEAVPGIVEGRRFQQAAAYYRGLYGAHLQEDPWLAVYLTDRCHPNVIGHELIAAELARVVEDGEAWRDFAGGPAAGPDR